MPELIDRIELRKDFCNMCEAMQPEMIDCEKKGCMSMQIIGDQPTIEAEPVRHGRWIDNGEDKFICSACKGYVYRCFGKSDFCPRCGADMREGRCWQCKSVNTLSRHRA